MDSDAALRPARNLDVLVRLPEDYEPESCTCMLYLPCHVNYAHIAHYYECLFWCSLFITNAMFLFVVTVVIQQKPRALNPKPLTPKP